MEDRHEDIKRKAGKLDLTDDTDKVKTDKIERISVATT